MEPLADVIALLRPRAAGTKMIQGAGRWGVRYSRMDYAGFGLVVAGGCWLAVDGDEPRRLARGDFVLMPAVPGFTIASDMEVEPLPFDADEAVARGAGDVRHGDAEREAEFKQLGGYFQLEPGNRGLFAGLLPGLVHIQATDPAAERLARMIDLITEEALANRPGRDLVVDRLIEVLLVEALRFHAERAGAAARPGLLSGLADPLLARALRQLHGDVARGWSVDALARQAGLSRSAFSERFNRKVGVPPMQYLIEWRIALAKAMLQRDAPPPLEAVAAAVGYQSASAFSTAFRREVGSSPSHFTRAAAA
ncbi:AraC family transcriptional regulator [Bosea sp. BIWAKO-01]|uniref:AraC family transcriptional regulator n=1 Tax=Bosea sp. BIWAKO-01 TaxID=506668 RepID=UPI00085316B6|nr:AraC family transcriptional regulator [Bosea sp. BIWAKO-01]